jgi:threonine/homoserine/homoserine lactone efflux protein|tara:strand:+ start:478 stop:1149 length:672 start_codon:yes stop_codon:yes gene_type:complete
MAKKTFLDSIYQSLTTDLGFGKSFFLGFMISVSGSMVIGALHLFAIQISIEQGWQSALMFSSGCALVEAIFVRYIVGFTQWVAKKKNGNLILEWTMLILFSILAIAVFYGAISTSSGTPTLTMPSILVPTFILGMGIRFFYPSMIPFWLAWNTALVTRKIQFKMWAFVIGAGLATLIAHSLYIFAGTLLVDFLKEKSQEILLMIGVIFLMTTFFQAKRMFWKK